MADFKVYNLEGEAVGSIAVAFNGATDDRVLHQTVVALRNGQRQGTHDTKGRGEVRGGGRKPWRQKGTGRARQGSRRAPHWKGGGTVHGPHPRSHGENHPRQLSQQSFRAAVAARLEEDAVRILDGATGIDGKTQSLLQILIRLEVADRKTVLLIANKDEAMVYRAARNLPFVRAQSPEQTNALDVLSSSTLVSTRAAFEALAKRLSA